MGELTNALVLEGKHKRDESFPYVYKGEYDAKRKYIALDAVRTPTGDYKYKVKDEIDYWGDPSDPDTYDHGYKGILNTEETYSVNDVVSENGSYYKKVVDAVDDWVNAKWENWESAFWDNWDTFNTNLILNDKYTADDSAYYQLVNDSLNSSLIVSTPLCDFLMDYCADTVVSSLNKDMKDSDMQKFLKTSISNLSKYNFFTNKGQNRTNKILYAFDTTVDATNKNRTLAITYNTFSKKSRAESQLTKKISITDDVLEFSGSVGQKTYIKHISSFIGGTTNVEEISNWGAQCIVPNILIDKYGHIKQIRTNQIFGIPKKPKLKIEQVDVNMKLTTSWKDTSDYRSQFMLIGSLLLSLYEKAGGFLEFAYTDRRGYYRRYFKVYIDTKQIVPFYSPTEWRALTPFLQYRFISVSNGSGGGSGAYGCGGGGGGGTAYTTIEFRLKMFKIDPVNNDDNGGGYEYDRIECTGLTSITLKYLSY